MRQMRPRDIQAGHGRAQVRKKLLRGHSTPLPLPRHLPLPALPGSVDDAVITARDLTSLSGMLNDAVVASNLHCAWERFPQLREKVLLIGTFLEKLFKPVPAAVEAAAAQFAGQRVPMSMAHLAGSQSIQRSQRRLGGTARILGAKWLLVPINGRLHWSLVLINSPGRPGSFMIHLDSCPGLHTAAFVADPLRAWLTCMVAERDGCSLDDAGLHIGTCRYVFCPAQQWGLWIVASTFARSPAAS